MLQGFTVGRLGKDADLRTTKEGTPVSTFSIAAEVGFGDRKKTLWVDCTIWGKMAESLTQYLRKGTQIAVSGELDVRASVSKESNEPGAAIQLTVRELTLCGSANGKAGK